MMRGSKRCFKKRKMWKTFVRSKCMGNYFKETIAKAQREYPGARKRKTKIHRVRLCKMSRKKDRNKCSFFTFLFSTRCYIIFKKELKSIACELKNEVRTIHRSPSFLRLRLPNYLSLEISCFFSNLRGGEFVFFFLFLSLGFYFTNYFVDYAHFALTSQPISPFSEEDTVESS